MANDIERFLSWETMSKWAVAALGAIILYIFTAAFSNDKKQDAELAAIRVELIRIKKDVEWLKTHSYRIRRDQPPNKVEPPHPAAMRNAASDTMNNKIK